MLRLLALLCKQGVALNPDTFCLSAPTHLTPSYGQESALRSGLVLYERGSSFLFKVMLERSAGSAPGKPRER